MARPKKDIGADARDRLIESFWSLLESNELHEVSIGMIAAKAGCSRGTFYYHFADKDALVEAILDDELQCVSRDIFAFNSGIDDAGFLQRFDEGGLKRVALFMRQGGRNIAESHTREYIFSMWKALLCSDDDELLPKTRCILSYMISGMLGLIAAIGDMGFQGRGMFPDDFLRNASREAFSKICETQNVDSDEVARRLSMLSRFSKADKSF